MCDNCNKNIEIDETEDIELTSEQLEGILGQTKDSETPIYYTEPILFDTENLIDVSKFDKEEFIKGIKEASYTAGFYTALVNSGMSNIDAMNFILSKNSFDTNIQMNKVNAESNIEVSKNQSIMIEKNAL